jgi:hypothetical protein
MISRDKRMANLVFFVLVLSALAVVGVPGGAPHLAAAEASWEVGAQGGLSINSQDESFTQYEVLLNRRLPWRWKWGGIIDVGTRATGTLGVLRGGGDTGVIGTLGFGFVFGDGHDFAVRAGSALTGLGRDNFGDEDFGSRFQFTHHIGLSYRLGDQLFVRARVQHMSNAGLASENPGLNMVMFGLHYEF